MRAIVDLALDLDNDKFSENKERNQNYSVILNFC